MRILISTWPAHGHLLPMLPLARAAQDAGHEVGVIVVGAKPGKESFDEITLFKALGLAVEDVATADLVHRRAIDTASAASRNPVS